jgi:hypothetical protein
MSDRRNKTRRIYVEDPVGERFLCEVDAEMPLSTLASDFFESRNWPTQDAHGRGQRAVVEVVDPDDPERTKRLRGEQTLEEAGLWDGVTLRIFPESRVGLESAETTLIDEIIERLRYDKVFHPIFRGAGFRPEPDMCFVLMPFSYDRHIQELYSDHTKPTLQRCNLRVQRADDIYGSRPIIDDIWSCINRARLIVAELTGRNANVFYEVGICHTLGKEVVMLAQSIDDVPFDLRYLRVITYEYTPRGCRDFETRLEDTVKSILQG